MPSSSNVAKLEDSKAHIANRYPSFANELFSFLERDQSTICWAKKWQHHLSAMRIAPSNSITNQFDISLEIPLLIATFAGETKLEPRILRHLDTSTELRKSNTADKDFAIIVASDRRADDYVKDRKRFSYPILTIYTDDLLNGKYAQTSLRSEIAKLMRSMNHFDYSSEIREAADFFGRVDDIEALSALARSGQSVGVFGLRRAGKTSLLHRVDATLREKGVESIYVELNALADADHLCEALVESTAQLLRRRGGQVPKNSEMLNRNFTIRTAKTVRRRWVYEMDALLKQIDSDVVVLLDETDLANEEAVDSDSSERTERQEMNRVLQQLRGVIQIRNKRSETRLSFLAAGVAASILTTSIRFGRDNQLFGFASARPLGPMNRDEMRQMVRVLGKRSGLRFDGYELFESLFAEYGGHPHLTRQACARVAEDVHDRQPDEVPYHVTLQDLEHVYASAADGSPAQSAWETFVSFERWYPDESEQIIQLIRHGEAPTLDLIPHAVGFGICDAQGQLRLGALKRDVRRGLG
ncbi:MAG: hypothetical protein OXF75_07730 [Acidimicrobiaceae bacterium]|nr:hypothetical protein [Acidimicrobiaceae bacterium]